MLSSSLCCQDVAVEIGKELQGKPDLIIGNYSDGNIVASLLAHKLGVTQVSSLRLIAHVSYNYCHIFRFIFSQPDS